MLSERIKMFTTISISTFDTYKKSSMCTVKWHALDHICDDIKRNGILFYVVPIFLSMHILFSKGSIAEGRGEMFFPLTHTNVRIRTLQLQQHC